MQAYLPVKSKSKTLRCLVDPDIATAFAGYRLWLASDGYVQAYQNHRQTYLHRCIVAARPGAHVDHKNGDRLDCRRANLRECSHSTNLHNMHTRSRARLGYYGVVPRKRQPVVYRVSLQLCNKTRACGAAWRSPVIASLVSDGFRRELLRSTVVTQNWPGTITPSRARVLLARPGADSIFIYPNPENPSRYVVVWSAKLLGAADQDLRAGWTPPLNLLPDYVQVKDSKIVAGGHFDSDWKTASPPQP